MTADEARLELLEARRIMCDANTGPDRMMTLIKALGWLLFNVPEEFVSFTQATIYEAERRLIYLEIGR